MIYIILITIVTIVFIAQIVGALITFAPILGTMVGALYSFTDYDDGREHTIQLCLFILSITIQWNTPPNGSEL